MNYAVILAGGKGLRVGGDIPKQLLPLDDKPVIAWSAAVFQASDLIDRIIIVAEENSIDIIQKMLPPEDYPKISLFIKGGTERSGSSYNALVSSEFSPGDIILFHDAARPFVSERIVKDTVAETIRSGAAGVYIPAVDTVTVIGEKSVKGIPERGELYYAQTPQGFRYSIIREAHEMYRNGAFNVSATDDVSLVHASGGRVSIVAGEVYNFKITTELDYRIARFIAESRLYI